MKLMTVKRLKNDSRVTDARPETHRMTLERLEKDSTVPLVQLTEDYLMTLK
jgi:hypothetical protein